MSYVDSLNQGGDMSPNAASLGLGKVPSMPGLPPPPTGTGAMPTGAPTTTKMTAGADAIAAIRSLQAFVPALLNESNDWIAKIKGSTSSKPGQNPGPAAGEPGIPGAAQLDGSQQMDSGGPGPF